MDLKTYIATERGRATKLAKQLGVSTSYLSQMTSGTAPISEERAVQIEGLTGGYVSRRDTHPDRWQKIWPELADT